MRRDPNLVFVTGAGSGIGRATARRFARMGATVVATDIRMERAVDTAAQIDHRGGTAHAYELDVADPIAFEALAETVYHRHGVADVVVNNAGMLVGGGALELSTPEWRRMLDVHLMGVVHGSRLFGAQMVERGKGGHLVNVSSAAAFLPNGYTPAYSTAKAGVNMLSECLRTELAPHGIGVSAMCFGLINTNIAQDSVLYGLNPGAIERSKRVAAALMPVFGASPDLAARAIVRSVQHNWTVVPVRPEAWLAVAASRLHPGAVRWFSGAVSARNVERLMGLLR